MYVCGYAEHAAQTLQLALFRSALIKHNLTNHCGRRNSAAFGTSSASSSVCCGLSYIRAGNAERIWYWMLANSGV